MPLIDLQTNLKDLKYGHDEYKGGSSNQPFINSNIPATNEPLQTSFDASIEGRDLAVGVTSLILGAAGGALVGGIFGGGATGALIGGGVTLGASILGTSELITGDIKYGSTSIKIPRAGTGGPDFLLRGGNLLPGIITDDIERITKFLTTTPSGKLFEIKQNILSRTGVRPVFTSEILNEGFYTPLSTIIQAGGNALGIHVNKQGLNPFKSLNLKDPNTFINRTPDLYADNAPFLRPIDSNVINSIRLFEKGSAKRLVQSGEGNSETPQKIEFISSNYDNEGNINDILSNRLVGLYGTKLLTTPLNTDRLNNVVSFANNGNTYYNLSYSKLTNISPNQFQLLKYPGGPGSILGIGDTIIKIATTNENAVSFTNNAVSPNTVGLDKISVLGDKNKILRSTYYGNLNKNSIEIDVENPKVIDFRRSLVDFSIVSTSTLRSIAPLYNDDKNKLENKTHLGDPGNVNNKNIISYTYGFNNNTSSFGAASPNSYDKINAYPIYITSKNGNNKAKDIKDLVQFRIGVINNDEPQRTEYIHFRAFLNNISDQYSSDWDSVKYIGRGEKLYTYAGFDRKISLSWTVAAQSKVELIPMYKKLNFLASICAPDYSKVGYLRGNIVKLTIGGYLYEQPGIITGFSYEMNDDNSSWEIGLNDIGETDSFVSEVPHLIKVTGFNFIPIHTFAPQKQKNNYNDTTGYIEGKVGAETDAALGYGNQRFIALNDKNSDNKYDVSSTLESQTLSYKQDQALYNLNGLTIDQEIMDFPIIEQELEDLNEEELRLEAAPTIE